jgi:signal transduction histidine kinase
MSIHPIPPPDEEPFQSPMGHPGAEVDAAMEAWAEVLKADARSAQLLRDLRAMHTELEERTRQAILMRHVANVLTATEGPGPVAHLILEILKDEVGASQGLVWVLGENRYTAIHGMDFDRSQLASLWLPVPHPFPHYPLLTYQCQWLEMEALPPGIRLIQARYEDGLYFVPLEHRTLLVGFAVLSVPRSLVVSPVGQESLEILQRLFAASLYSIWMLQDLQQQRERIKEEAKILKARAESLDRRNQSLRQGPSFRADFLTYAASELRGQLHGLLALLGRLRVDDTLGSQERGVLLLDGLLSGKHMAELLRVLAELPAQKEIEAEPLVRGVALQGLLDHLRPVVDAFPRRPGGKLLWPDAADLPEVYADAERLRQALLALCAGALRNSGDGSLRLWIEREPSNLFLKLWVENLDLGETAQVFNSKKTVQPEELFLKGQGGDGLGLVLCRQLMIDMGCGFQLERDPSGAGTIISLELPLA